MEFPKRSGKQARREVVKNIAYLMHSFEYTGAELSAIVIDARFQVDIWETEGYPKEKRIVEAR